MTKHDPFLSEFAAEEAEQEIGVPQAPGIAVADLREMFKAGKSGKASSSPRREAIAVPRKRIGVWPLAAFFVLVALAAVVAAVLWNLYADSRGTSAALPTVAPPQRLVPAIPVVSPPPGFETDRASTGSATAGPHLIQVAFFEARVRAERLLSVLATAGVEGRIVERDLGPAGVLHRVVVGGFATIDEADADLARVHALPGYADAHVVSN